MSIAAAAKPVYERELRQRLENEHHGDFVAIEPESNTYYIAKTFLDAALAARKSFPARKPFVIRIGFDAAFHIGAFSK